MLKYLLTVQIEKDILHLSISLGNKPMALGFSQNMLHPQFRVSPFGHFCMACNHFEAVLEFESTSCPSARTQGPGTPPALQPGAPLFAIRVCLLLAVLAQWLCGRFWTFSRASGAGRGLFPTTHVAAIKRRKGPCSRGPLLLPALPEIPQSRCYSNWTHFQCLKEGKTRRNSLSSYTTSPLQVVNNETDYIFVCPFFSPLTYAWLYSVGFFSACESLFFIWTLNLNFIKTSASGVTYFCCFLNAFESFYSEKDLNIFWVGFRLLKEFKYNIQHSSLF